MSIPPSEPATGEPSNATNVSNVSAASIKLPPMWKETPEVWFRQIEAQFEVAGIVADNTKFNYIIGVLDQCLCNTVSDVLMNPPLTERYTTLKQAIISRLSASTTSQISQLLGDVDMGDRTPSQFLRELRLLAKDRVSEEFLRSMWLRRLPEKVRLVLATHPGNLEQLAASADQVVELIAQPAVFTTSNPFVNNSEITQLRQQIQQLNQQFQMLLRPRSRSKSRFSSRTRSNSRNSSSQPKRSTWCWYHRRFATKANKCEQPCTFNSNKTLQNSTN